MWPKAVNAFAFDSFVALYRCCRVSKCENLRCKRNPNRLCTWKTNRMILLNRFDRATRIDRIDWFFHRKLINFRHRKQTILYNRFFWMNTKICWIYIFSIKLVFNSIMEHFFRLEVQRSILHVNFVLEINSIKIQIAHSVRWIIWQANTKIWYDNHIF